MIGGGGADLDEFGRVVAQPPGAAEQRVEQRVHDGAVLRRADEGAVLRRDVVDMRDRGVAAGARHVGHHHGGIAGNVFAHVAGDQPGVDVVAAAG